MAHRFTGLVAPPFTPMHPDGSVNLPMIDKLAQALVADGITAVYPCGASGESLSLSVDERMAIVERWQSVAGDALPVIAHVGHLVLSDTKAMAAHAQRTGVSAIAAIPPCFFRPSRLEEMVAWYAEISTAAPDLPLYIYHIPVRTGVAFPMLDFFQAATPHVPTLAGVKFSYDDFRDLRQTVAFDGGRLNVLFGREEMLLSGLITGVDGSISTGYNFAAPLYHRILDAYKAGDIATAQAEQLRSANLVAILKKHGFFLKYVMKMLGLDCGPLRLPMRNPTPDECQAVRADLEAFGFFDDCAGGGA